MKKWQITGLAAALVAGAAGMVGATTLAGPPPPPAPYVTLPSTVVVANPDWAGPPTTQQRPATLPAAPALPKASGAVLFSTDFSSSDSSAWASPLLPDSDMAPLWLVQNGLLQQAGDVNQESRLEESYRLTGQPTWHDLVFEASLLATSGEGAGLVWDVQDGSFYRVQLFPNLPNQAAKARLERVTPSQVTVLAEAPLTAYAGYQPYVWQSLRVQSRGGHQQVWVNGAPLFDVTDNTLTAGQVGLFAWADSGTRFDNVRVQSASGQ